MLGSAEGRPNLHLAAELGIDRQRVRRWRVRWAQIESALAAAEAQAPSDEELEAKILDALSDNYRSGTPPKFTPEQVVAIVALACEPPADSARPISHWSTSELADEIVKRRIAESISPRQVGRFLAKRT